jgi:ABC-type nitrate/sulfonate/bicarbonate transport system permease component
MGAFLFFVFVVILGFAAYVSNLDNELPDPSQTEKRGRAQYLIDIRWPYFNPRTLFDRE